MCIIAIKPQGKDFPSMETMERCWDGNSDGFGFMYNDTKSVVIHKGYMTKDSFKAVYSKILRDKKLVKYSFVFHFRIATHGSKNEKMTHPFPVTSDPTLVEAGHAKVMNGFAHNGMLYDVPADVHFSDTAQYVLEYLSKVPIADRDFTQYFLDSTAESSRFVLLYSDGHYLTAGNWEKDGDLLWSNSGYKERTYGSRLAWDTTDDEWLVNWKRNGPGYKVTPSGVKKVDTIVEPVRTRNKWTYLPKNLVVYGTDGIMYSQGSRMLDSDEKFFMDDDDGLWAKKTKGEFVFVDYVTQADGQEVEL